ncbi:unnamed protein product [Mycena citricolor]|uniref:NADH dehydrogenase [ubiquinone] 1 alpha subcomplex assembly factor 3 n=1 Tax=Mycena citricolor TaxID=2018698 RepID=A0AAD2HJN9_9AGAR|nr:unnamed protein product [Mycena citricolor]
MSASRLSRLSPICQRNSLARHFMASSRNLLSAPALSTRSLHTTTRRRNPGEAHFGLTNILASDAPPPVQVSAVSEEGIMLEDGLLLTGATIFLDGKVFLWDVPERVTDWKREHLAMFEVCVPKPGTGNDLAHPPPSVKSYLTDLGIQVDVMSTRNACSTYNLLSEEGRRVAAAMSPLVSKRWARPSASQ